MLRPGEATQTAVSTRHAALTARGECVGKRTPAKPGRRAWACGDLEDLFMKALVYHGPNQKAWEEVPNPKDRRPERCHCAGGHDHNLWHRPAHPQGGRPGSRSEEHTSELQSL